MLIGVVLFAGAYMAEVVRGGLQAIPRGQFEGAHGARAGLLADDGASSILPQALKLVIPGIVNSFIALFKDTTLVLIVAIFDLLGQMRAAFADPNWATPVTLFTGFAFAGIDLFRHLLRHVALCALHRAAAEHRRSREVRRDMDEDDQPAKPADARRAPDMRTTENEIAVEIVGLNKWFGAFHVLRDVNLKVMRGERIVICGPSGSGKSTLLALHQPDRGLAAGPRHRRRRRTDRRPQGDRRGAPRGRHGVPAVQPVSRI